MSKRIIKRTQQNWEKNKYWNITFTEFSLGYQNPSPEFSIKQQKKAQAWNSSKSHMSYLPNIQNIKDYGPTEYVPLLGHNTEYFKLKKYIELSKRLLILLTGEFVDRLRFLFVCFSPLSLWDRSSIKRSHQLLAIKSYIYSIKPTKVYVIF